MKDVKEAKKFKRTILPFQPAMQQTAKRLLGDRAEAEDAVQDSMIRLWEIRDRIEDDRNVEAFCITLVKRHCIDLLRKRQATVPLDEAVLMGVETESAAQIEERYRRMKAEVRRLPLQQRKAVLLKFVQGKENQEIAERLHVSMNNLYVILSRAQKALRKTQNECE